MNDKPLTLQSNHADYASSSQAVKAEGGSTVSNVTQVIADKYYSRSQAEELSDYLARAVSAYEARMYRLVARPPTPPDRPYKFLYAFEIEDADIFFGRDAASQTLYQTVLKDRLTVLHAKSGAGKTSLLNAGLSPRLISEGRLPVYARVYEDPVLAIKRAIAPPSLGSWPELLPKLTLHEFLGLVCAHLSRQTEELVVVLDQFEEFFIFWPERDLRQPFIDALADSYEDKSLPVRFIIALRKDYYSDLATVQQRLHHVFHNEFHLDAMDRGEAQEAITGPATKRGRPVVYEQALLDTLLDDLVQSGMELPHLQTICTQLYEALQDRESTLTLADYERLDRAEGILAGYLGGTLAKLPGTRETIAREVLKELVSSEASKRVLSHAGLAARVKAEPGELDAVLGTLVDARLLRREEEDGQVAYEMAHEYLIREIGRWIDQEDLAVKHAQELLAREVANWRVYHTLIPLDRLELLYAQRERFTGLDDESWQCILLSALQAEIDAAGWIELAGERGEAPLLAALSDPRGEVCRAATRGLGKIWDLPEVFRLGDRDTTVRWKAAITLQELREARAAEPLIAALRDENARVRQAAAESLGRIGDARAVEPLIATMRDEDDKVREGTVRALGQLGDAWAVEPLLAILENDEDGVRQAAAAALRRLGDSRAVEPLIATLKDEDDSVRVGTARLLGQLGDARAVEPLIAALEDKGDDVRQAAVESLMHIGDARAMEPLIFALGDENHLVRQTAARALGQLGDVRAVEPLHAAMLNKEGSIHEEAAEALGQLGEPAVEPLIAALCHEGHEVRQAAAKGLGRLGDARAIEPLIAALCDVSASVRQAATHSLGTIWVLPEVSHLGDKRAWERRVAVQALEQLGDVRAVKPLIAALCDKSSTVRQAAARALGQLKDTRAVEPLIAVLQDEYSPPQQIPAREARQLRSAKAVELYFADLQDQHNGVRKAAAQGLGEIGDVRAVEPLVAALQDESSLVHDAAVGALEQLGTPEALAALEARQKE